MYVCMLLSQENLAQTKSSHDEQLSQLSSEHAENLEKLRSEAEHNAHEQNARHEEELQVSALWNCKIYFVSNVDHEIYSSLPSNLIYYTKK